MVGLKTASPEIYYQGQQTRKITRKAQRVNIFPAKLANTKCLTFYCNIDTITLVNFQNRKKCRIVLFQIISKYKMAAWILWYTQEQQKGNPESSYQGAVNITAGIWTQRHNAKRDLPNIADRHDTSLEISLGMYFPKSLGNYMVAGRSPVLMTGALLPKINISIKLKCLFWYNVI